MTLINEKLQYLSSLQKPYLGKDKEFYRKNKKMFTRVRINKDEKIDFVLKTSADEEKLEFVLNSLIVRYDEFSMEYLEEFIINFLSPENKDGFEETKLYEKLDELKRTELKKAIVTVKTKQRFCGIWMYDIERIKIAECELIKEGEDQITFKIEVKACDLVRRRELAREKIEEAFNILAILTNQGKMSLEPPASSIGYMIKTESDRSVTSYGNSADDHLSVPVILTNDFLSFLEEPKILTTINKSYKEPEKLYDKKLKRAIYWLGNSIRTRDPVIRYLYSVQVLETLLKGENEKTELTRLISQRGSYILASRYNENVSDVLTLLSKAYGNRSRIVHCGDIEKVDKENINKLVNIARAVFLDFLYFKDKGLYQLSNTNNKYFESLDVEIVTNASLSKK